MGKLYAVGFGPGGYEHMTAKAIDVIKNADIITGYTTYVEMLKKFFPEKEYVATPMTKEMDRCRMAVDLAAEGKTVAMVSSGDSGIYGMAGILLEIANEKKADVEIETPIEKCMTPMIAGRKLAVVPILRAGLGMVSGILALVPSAKVGHIGMYRDEETHEPQEYYCKLPNPIEERTIVVCDPMLATGGSAVDAINQIKKHGGKNIKFMCIIAAPEGLERLHKEHPDIQIYVGHVDRQLNENAYICPGLGDAGDRIFGTK